MAYKDDDVRRSHIRQHYADNKEYYRLKNRRRQKEALDALREYKTGKPCLDCGVEYPYYVMDLHHRDPLEKKSVVGKRAASGVKALLREAAKCDLICANCHRERTHNPGLLA